MIGANMLSMMKDLFETEFDGFFRVADMEGGGAADSSLTV